jgi:hypothetical protein
MAVLASGRSPHRGRRFDQMPLGSNLLFSEPITGCEQRGAFRSRPTVRNLFIEW